MTSVYTGPNQAAVTEFINALEHLTPSQITALAAEPDPQRPSHWQHAWSTAIHATTNSGRQPAWNHMWECIQFSLRAVPEPNRKVVAAAMLNAGHAILTQDLVPRRDYLQLTTAWFTVCPPRTLNPAATAA